MQLLLEEHRLIERMLGVLDELVRRLESEREVPASVVEAALRFLIEFTDGLHHAKEEHVLFPLLARHDIGPDQPFINALAEHHDMGRSYVRRMAGAWRAVQRAVPDAHIALASEMRSYVELLREHIRIEDEFLRGVADEYLSADDDRELVEGFVAIDDSAAMSRGLDATALVEECHRGLEER